MINRRIGLEWNNAGNKLLKPQVEALFDVCVIDTDAPSHCHRAPNAILESSSQGKKRMYKKAVEDRRGTFTPFVLSVDGLLHKEASHFIKHMATALSSKWDKASSHCMYFMFHF